MQYVLLIYQGTFWGALSDLSEDERKALVAEYGEINHAPGVTPGLPLGLPEDATSVRVQEWEDANQRRPIHRYRGSHRRLVRLRGRRSRRRDRTCLSDPSSAAASSPDR
jgi:hypothetical protein